MCGDYHDLIEHTVHIGFEIDVPDAKNLVAERIEMLRSQAISFDANWVCMLRTVQLNDELRGFAKKVSDVGAAGRLSPKLQSIQAAVAQSRPEAAFVLSLTAAQQARISGETIGHYTYEVPRLPFGHSLPSGRG